MVLNFSSAASKSKPSMAAATGLSCFAKGELPSLSSS
jgi:hypothetical protein